MGTAEVLVNLRINGTVVHRFVLDESTQVTANLVSGEKRLARSQHID